MGNSRSSASEKIVRWLGWWLVLWTFYLLLAEKLQWSEIVLGTVAAALAATAVTATQATGQLFGKPRWRWIVPLLRIPPRAIADCGIVVAAICQRVVGREQVRGSFRTVPIDAGGDEPRAVMRRALVILGVSLAPNTYVVAIDDSHGQMLVHQLVPSPQPPGGGDREWPL